MIGGDRGAGEVRDQRVSSIQVLYERWGGRGDHLDSPSVLLKNYQSLRVHGGITLPEGTWWNQVII